MNIVKANGTIEKENLKVTFLRKTYRVRQNSIAWYSINGYKIVKSITIAAFWVLLLAFGLFGIWAIFSGIELML